MPQPAASAPPLAVARPKPMVLVALGFGPPEPCAEQLAQHALAATAAGAEPLQVAAALLDALRRVRWPEGEGTFSSILRGSDGRFGGLQQAPSAALSSASLVKAVERRAIIDGTNPRGVVAAGAGEPDPGLSFPSCSEEAPSSLEGTPGVLMRTEAGAFWGGLVSPDLPADAGVLSVVAQYGVSVAVGGAGGVLLITDCPSPPAESLAERVYGSHDWVAAAAETEARGGCRVGYALLTPERAWVQSSAPLAWAALEREAKAAPPPAATPPVAPPPVAPPPVVPPSVAPPAAMPPVAAPPALPQPPPPAAPGDAGAAAPATRRP